MLEWPNDWGMRVISFLRVLSCFKNLASLRLIWSFHHRSWMPDWSKNDWNDTWMISLHHKIPFPHHFDILEWWWNDRMRRNERFFCGGKIFAFEDTCHSAITPSFKHHSILVIAYLWDKDEMSLNESKMRSEWFNPGLSPYRRQAWIKLFGPHLTSFRNHFRD